MRPCTCTDGAIARYRARLSGPLLDRLDLRVDVPSVTFAELSSGAPGESSAAVRERVRAARRLLEHAVDRFGLSARAHDRALRVALTIKDLCDVRRGTASASWPLEVDESHVGEALSYRQVNGESSPLVATNVR